MNKLLFAFVNVAIETQYQLFTNPAATDIIGDISTGVGFEIRDVLFGEIRGNVRTSARQQQQRDFKG